MSSDCEILKFFVQDLAVMDADEIFSKQLHQMEKEKKERDGKLKAQEKKVRTLINDKYTVCHWYNICPV
jgi:hypothetical protein